MADPRFKPQYNPGFGTAIVDTTANKAVCWVDLGYYNDGTIASAIANALNAADPQLNLDHEEDADA